MARPRTAAAYRAYDTTDGGLGLKANTAIAAQIVGSGDPHHPVVGAIAAGAAIVATIADTFVAVPDPTVRYATFDE